MALGEMGGPSKHAFATGPFGSAIASKFFVASGIPVIRGSNLSREVGKRLIRSGFVYVPEEKAEQHTRSIAIRGDLVFTCWGTVGQVGYIDKGCEGERFLISNKQMKMTPDPEQADGLFLYYLLSSPAMVQEVQDRAIGAAVPGFNLGQLRELRVKVPCPPTQRRIAAVLSAFDELIEISERRIELLEDLARSLYREWFVQFRFPGHEEVELVDSELGQIPWGWKVGSVGHVAPGPTRGIAPKYADDGSWTVINQRCIRHQRVTLAPARRHEGAVPDAKRLRFGDVLINSTGVGTLGRVAVLYEENDKMTADSHVTIARPGAPEFHPWFGLHLLSRETAFQAMGTGSTGQTELGRTAVGDLPVAIPPRPVLEAFGGVIWPLLRPIPALSRFRDALAETRDLLLPRLVTGRLDIAHVDLGVLTPTEVE